jgi:toxin YoeB
MLSRTLMLVVTSLKHDLSGYWSRRITDEHRFVYKIVADSLFLAQLCYHY